MQGQSALFGPMGYHQKFADAKFSPCRTWRYTLHRVWDGSLPQVMFIGLNPSTADELVNDPTVRRCIGYSRSWGYGGLVMTNIFAFRATYPGDMKAAADPVGPENDYYLKNCAGRSGIIIAAWGNHGSFKGRNKEVLGMIRAMGLEVHALRITAQGEPCHPLYLPKGLKPVVFK